MNDILIALAVWRISLMLVQERGLFGVFIRWRKLVHAESNIIPDYNTGETLKPSGELGELFSCVWCLSIWFSALAVLLAGKPIWYILAYSGMAILFQEFMMRG